MQVHNHQCMIHMNCGSVWKTLHALRIALSSACAGNGMPTHRDDVARDCFLHMNSFSFGGRRPEVAVERGPRRPMENFSRTPRMLLEAQGVCAFASLDRYDDDDEDDGHDHDHEEGDDYEGACARVSGLANWCADYISRARILS